MVKKGYIMLFRKRSRKSPKVIPTAIIGLLANFNGAPGTLAWETTQPGILFPPEFSGYNGYNLANGLFGFKDSTQGQQGGLVIPGSSRTNISNTDFTLEIKGQLPAGGSNSVLFQYGASLQLIHRSGGYMSLYIGNVVPEIDYIMIPNLVNGATHHIVFSYDTDRFKLMADGVLLAEAIRPNTLEANGAIKLIHSNGYGDRWKLDAIKLTNNVALYKGATYSVPVGDLKGPVVKTNVLKVVFDSAANFATALTGQTLNKSGVTYDDVKKAAIFNVSGNVISLPEVRTVAGKDWEFESEFTLKEGGSHPAGRVLVGGSDTAYISIGYASYGIVLSLTGSSYYGTGNGAEFTIPFNVLTKLKYVYTAGDQTLKLYLNDVLVRTFTSVSPLMFNINNIGNLSTYPSEFTGEIKSVTLTNIS